MKSKSYMILLAFLLIIIPIAFAEDNPRWAKEIESGNQEITYFPTGTSPLIITDVYGTTHYITQDNTIRLISSVISGTADTKTAVIVKIRCTGLEQYNTNVGANIQNVSIVIAYMHKLMNGTTVGDKYVFYPPSTRASLKNILFVLNPKDYVEVGQFYTYSGTPNIYVDYPCQVNFRLPSFKNDDMESNGKSLSEEEDEMSEDIKQETMNIRESTKDLIEIIFEVITILYWMFKILIVILGISVILWIFIWFYKLIKKVFGGGGS